MHPGRRAALQEQAHARIVSAATVLGERFQLATGAPIPTTVNARHPEIAALEQQQAVADLLDALVQRTAPPADSPASVTALGLPADVADVLNSAGITAEDAAAMSDDELDALPGIGPATVRRIRDALRAQGYEDASPQ